MKNPLRDDTITAPALLSKLQQAGRAAAAYVRQRNPDLPEIASLRMQGYSVEQIAEKLDVLPRTVDRRILWINRQGR